MMQYYSGQGTGEGHGEQAPRDPLVAQRQDVVGRAAGATLLAFERQSGVPAEELSLQYPQPSNPEAPEALGEVATQVAPPFPQGSENYS